MYFMPLRAGVGQGRSGGEATPTLPRGSELSVLILSCLPGGGSLARGREGGPGSSHTLVLEVKQGPYRSEGGGSWF